MAANLNSTILSQVIDQAIKEARDHPRWLHAIERAVAELVGNPWIERQDDHLLIASPSGELYSANGVCQCEAYARNIPCWHRAAARLVRRHDEALAQQTDRATRLIAAQRVTELLNECFA